jgi:hypothetical protein
MLRCTRNVVMAGLTALFMGGAMLASVPAQAGASTGTWKNGMVAGPYGVGCYNARCAARNYGYRGSPYRRHHYRPVQVYPSYGYRHYRRCHYERTRFVNHRGHMMVRRVRVCR